MYSGDVESSRIYHQRYHMAVTNAKRRKILKLLKENGEMTIDEISQKLNIDKDEAEYHMKMLEWGFCVVRRGKGWRLTKEGEVVEHL